MRPLQKIHIMKNIGKQKIKILAFINIVLCLISCNKTPNRYTYDGMIQGTYYHIVFYAQDDKGIKQGIDSIYKNIDNSLSLWNKNSILNKINNNENPILDKVFIDNFRAAEKFSSLTDGAFDITVGALVKAQGFTTEKREKLSNSQIDSLLKYVGYKNLAVKDNRLIKKYPQTKLDFNAIAQGYTSDCIASYLRKHNINSFVIDVGGEVMTGDLKPDQSKWRIGIETPSDKQTQETDNRQNEQRKTSAIVLLENESIVTSGNYRKFYIENGMKYSHTIDPKTGCPVTHSLLSASVIASTATEADALATAFMVMGVEKVQKFLKTHKNYPTYLIYSDCSGKIKTWQSSTFTKYLRK